VVCPAAKAEADAIKPAAQTQRKRARMDNAVRT